MIAIIGLGILGTRVVQQIDPDEHLLLVDYDYVEHDNIPKQYPHQAHEMEKVEAARKFYHAKATVLHVHLDATTIGVLADASIVIDCTDNVLARRVINDYCTKEGIPWIHGALSDTAGTIATFIPDGPCFTCVYPQAIGENCTPALNARLAERTAAVIITELKKLKKEPISQFVRVTLKDIQILEMTKRGDCPTCTGHFPYLHPHDFYITYCVNSDCMAAKPLRPKHHDHGTPREMIIEGMRLSAFPNGEIHFFDEADDDVLHDIAAAVYKQFPF